MIPPQLCPRAMRISAWSLVPGAGLMLLSLLAWALGLGAKDAALRSAVVGDHLVEYSNSRRGSGMH
jgi:hypothetical protein